MMEDRNQEIIEYLRREDVQTRILQRIHHGREEASVTISNAARLFGFTENQLRDWDEKGLLKPQRPTVEFTQDGKGPKRRQYAPAELDKLAIIRELMNKGFSPGTIPPNIDEVWSSITSSSQPRVQTAEAEINEAEHLNIDQRVELADQALFWRHFASQALRLSLMLICEDIPDTIGGLILPLRLKGMPSVPQSKDLKRVGESLVGWLDKSRSIYVFLDSAPSFEYASDFRILPLQTMQEDVSVNDAPKDNTLIVVQRKVPPLSLSSSAVQTIRRLIAPLYNVKDWQPYFGQGIRDTIYPATDFHGSTSSSILDGLADMIIHLGGQTADCKDRWRFCCILLPNNSSLPLRRRSLIIQAQSRHSPHKVGTIVSPDKSVDSLTLRAFQSGHIIYRPEISLADATIALRELEGDIRSAIAVAVGGEKGQPVAVLYIASDETRAFSKDDQRVLRMIARIVEESVLTYHARQLVTENLGGLLRKPGVIDSFFEDFLSENDFRRDIEEILVDIRKQMLDEQAHKEVEVLPDREYIPRMVQTSDEVISFISIDLDNQRNLATKYGDSMLRNLSRAIGIRLQEMLKSQFTKHKDCTLYYIYGNRYYLLLKGISLEQARSKAEVMRHALEGDISIDQPTLPNVVLSDVTVRLGVTSYTYSKLEENLIADDTMDIVAEVKAKIARSLDVALKMGMDEGGNVVIAWNRDIAGGAFVRWSPAKMK